MANTVIGSSFRIDGEIIGNEEVLVQGSVKGKISLKERVVIDAKSVVEADIAATSIEILGQVEGNIVASEKIELRNEAHVVGELRTPRILIADGANFQGSIDMSTDGFEN